MHVPVKLSWQFVNISFASYLTRDELLVKRIVVKKVEDNSSTSFALTAGYSPTTHAEDYKIWWNNVDQACKEKISRDLIFML